MNLTAHDLVVTGADDSYRPGIPMPMVSPEDLNVPLGAMEGISTALEISNALPNLVKNEATALLLDVNNLYRRAHAAGFNIDYARLKSIFENRCDLRYCGAFSAVDRNDSKARGWEAYMNERGYTVTSKDLKRYTNARGVLVTKGNMDIEIACEAMSLSPGFAHIIIGTCDGDFVPLVNKLREGKFRKVSVLGITSEAWAGMSETLARAADNFYDLSEIKNHIHYRGK